MVIQFSTWGVTIMLPLKKKKKHVAMNFHKPQLILLTRTCNIHKNIFIYFRNTSTQQSFARREKKKAASAVWNICSAVICRKMLRSTILLLTNEHHKCHSIRSNAYACVSMPLNSTNSMNTFLLLMTNLKPIYQHYLVESLKSIF
jgi:hypothetical protein